jgi:hypothetical protein
VNGFSIVVQSAPIDAVIAGVLANNNKIILRRGQGFRIPAGGSSGGGHEQGPHKRDELELGEKVRVEAGDLRIEVDVRVRGGRYLKHEPHALKEAGAVADYDSFARADETVLSTCLTQLGSSDPFNIAGAIAAMTSAPEGDLSALVTVHANVLNKFDAFMTMLQKALGDRADIVQMVRWHRAPCASALLEMLPETAGVVNQLDAFIAEVAARTMKISDYQTLLVNISPALSAMATAIRAAAALSPLIAGISGTASARAAEKAHRYLLIALAQYV